MRWSAVCLATLGNVAALRTNNASSLNSERDLILMHVPFNFGHTVEKVAMFDEKHTLSDMFLYTMRTGGLMSSKKPVKLETARRMMKPGGELWGHLNPDLQVRNPTTGCSTYFTPQKYWPEETAKKYFQNKTVFGMLRDPYERLVAIFRGDRAGYGGAHPKFASKCDVNGGVKYMLKQYMESNDKFMQECTFVPQAEYFEGPYGITLPVDNRLFPSSMNKIFKEHGYTNMHINTQDILHVKKCTEVWAADLDEETKAMIRQVYAKDFELLCKHFGYCDTTENTCIQGVPAMCPQSVLMANYSEAAQMVENPKSRKGRNGR